MAVNEIVTSGAEPLFFLDYLASSDLSVDMAEKIIHGIVEGCRMSNCALLGGEVRRDLKVRVDNLIKFPAS